MNVSWQLHDPAANRWQIGPITLWK